MNADIRSNALLDSPYFDLAGHIGNRAYCLHNVVYAHATEETAALLDIGVKDLLATPMPSPTVASPKGVAFNIRQSDPKNGLGMFAARNISAGGIIVVERPILVAPYLIALESHRESELFTALLRRLSPETVARFMSLANCKPESECDMVEGIVRTNAIAITLDVPDVPHPELATHRGIFLNISRCNHRCVFRLFFTAQTSLTQSLQLRPKRQVAMGPRDLFPLFGGASPHSSRPRNHSRVYRSDL